MFCEWFWSKETFLHSRPQCSRQYRWTKPFLQQDPFPECILTVIIKHYEFLCIFVVFNKHRAQPFLSWYKYIYIGMLLSHITYATEIWSYATYFSANTFWIIISNPTPSIIGIWSFYIFRIYYCPLSRLLELFFTNLYTKSTTVFMFKYINLVRLPRKAAK